MPGMRKRSLGAKASLQQEIIYGDYLQMYQSNIYCSAVLGAVSKIASRSPKPDMRKLPRGIAKAVEDLVDSSQWLDWRHFDAGVMKVLQQLALANEQEAFIELQQVEDSELSSVKNMPAYLNKCFNNRLWKVRP